MNIFTENFLNVPTSVIAKSVREDGYYKFEQALTEDFISNVQKDVGDAGISLNNNNVSGVYFTHGNDFFLLICWLHLKIFTIIVQILKL